MIFPFIMSLFEENEEIEVNSKYICITMIQHKTRVNVTLSLSTIRYEYITQNSKNNKLKDELNSFKVSIIVKRTFLNDPET